eukprot:305669-Pyramimonas_sp.AAC.1
MSALRADKDCFVLHLDEPRPGHVVQIIERHGAHETTSLSPDKDPQPPSLSNNSVVRGVRVREMARHPQEWALVNVSEDGNDLALLVPARDLYAGGDGEVDGDYAQNFMSAA